jgi:hypothetical protein
MCEQRGTANESDRNSEGYWTAWRTPPPAFYAEHGQLRCAKAAVATPNWPRGLEPFLLTGEARLELLHGSRF